MDSIKPMNLNQLNPEGTNQEEMSSSSSSFFSDCQVFSNKSFSGKEKEIFIPEILKLKTDGVQNTFDIILQQKQGQLTLEQANNKIKSMSGSLSLLPELPEGLAINSQINGVRLESKVFGESFTNKNYANLSISAVYLLNTESMEVVATNAGKEAYIPVITTELKTKIDPYKANIPFKIGQTILNILFIPELKPIAEADALCASNDELTRTIVGDKAFVYDKKLFKFKQIETLASLLGGNKQAIESFFMKSNDSILNKLVLFIKENGKITKENIAQLKQVIAPSITEFNKLLTDSVAPNSEVSITTDRAPNAQKTLYATISIKK